MEKYVAGYHYGQSRLVKVIIKKETPKTYSIESHERILDAFFYVPTRMSKDKYLFFDTLLEAIEYLIKRCHKYKKDLYRSIETVEGETDELNRMLDAIL